ncbi:MAG: hypothetical protein RL660_3148 [Bacteroidota bacterium]
MQRIYLYVTILCLAACSCVQERGNKTNHEQANKCEELATYIKCIDTTTTVLDIGTKLFWNYNCDSIWLTYINCKKDKVVLDNWHESQILSVKLGLCFLQEYQSKMLFQRAVISGCCDLPNKIIYDKASGKVLKNIGPAIWYSKDKKYPLLICIEQQDSIKLGDESTFHKLIVYNLDRDTQHQISLSGTTFFTNLHERYLDYGKPLLETYTVSDNKLSLLFTKEDAEHDGHFLSQTIKLNLDNYCK